MIAANNPKLRTWISVPENSDFPIQNIPFGIIELNGTKAAATRIGDTVVNLSVLFDSGVFEDILKKNCFAESTLNTFLKFNKQIWRAVRNRISEVFTTEMDEDLKDRCLLNINNVKMCMPVQVGDYTDFYSSRQHAYNVGCMFRDPKNALLPNWLHIPVGYHGRSSSIVLSGTNIKRPSGLILDKITQQPYFSKSKLLDFELEMAFVTGQGKSLGKNISTMEAEDFIFGLCIFNDWAARDIQKYEYVPLGPFLGKKLIKKTYLANNNKLKI